MLNDIETMLSRYKQQVELHCSRNFEEHRKLPCGLVKDAVINNTVPSCKGCTFERK